MPCKRQRSFVWEDVGFGDGPIFTGRRGRIPSRSEATIYDEPQRWRPEGFVPVVIRTAQAPNAQQVQHEDVDAASPITSDAYVHRPAEDDRRRRRQHEKEQESLHWQEALPENLFRRTCALAGESQRRQQLLNQLQADFIARVASVPKICHSCKTAEHLQPLLPSQPIIFAGIHAHVTVDKPTFMCGKCSAQISLHPLSIGCFPATPSRANVWYDTQLLVVTSAAQHSGPTAIQAHCAALKQRHTFNGP